MDNLNTDVMVAIETAQRKDAIFELGDLAGVVCGSGLGEIVIG